MNKLFATIIALLLSATATAQTYEQLVENGSIDKNKIVDMQPDNN